MADVVENQVVEMRFDNKDFESGVSTSLSTLDKLKEALRFDNASKGFSQIQNSIKSLDFSPIQSSLSALESSFTTLWGSLKRNFFDQISNSLLNVGQQLYQNTLGQIKSGGQKRAMNIEQAKFKISGLNQDWDTVYKDMDYAVSGTAYGIDQAANAASQFLASGVKTGDDMKAALRGISGIAAMTSADYDEIANVFTSAAGKGKVQAMELNRISQRGVNAASALAKSLGTTEEAVRDMASKGEIDFNTFAKAMDDAFGEHAKKANETFTGSLSNMKAALSRIGEIFYAPYLENMIPIYNRLREVIDKVKNAMKEPLNEDKESVASRIADLYKALKDLFLAWADTWNPALDNLSVKANKWFESLGYLTKKVEKFQKVLVDVANGAKSVIKNTTVDMTKLTKQEEQAARDIWILGNWGNGEERRKNLEAAGMSYERVQTVVNKIVEGTYVWDKWLFKAAGVAKDSSEAADIHSWAVTSLLNAYTALHDIVNTIQIAFQKLWKILRAVWRAYVTTWAKLSKITDGVRSPFQELIDLVKDLLKHFVIAGNRTKYLKQTFQGLFSLLKLGSYILSVFIKSLHPIGKVITKDVDAPILKMTASWGQAISAWVEAVLKAGNLKKAIEKVALAVKTVVRTIGDLISGKTTFKEVFEKIISKIKDFIGKLKTSSKDIDSPLGKIFEKLKSFAIKIKEFFGDKLKVDSPLKDILSKVKDFVSNILTILGHGLFGSNFSFADWFKKIFNKEEAEGEVKESKGIIPTIAEKVKVIGAQLIKLWDVIKTVASAVFNAVTSVWTFIQNGVKALSGVFTSIIGFIQKIFDTSSANMDSTSILFRSFADFISTCFIAARDIVWAIKEPLKDIAVSVADMISGIANMLAGITNWVGNDPEQAYGAAAFFALIKLIEKIVEYKGLKKKGSLENTLASIAGFFDSMKSAVSDWKKQNLARVFEIIGNTMIKIALAMFILVAAMTGLFGKGTSQENAMDAALVGFIMLSAFMWEIFALLLLMKKKFSKPIEVGFLTAVLTSMATAMLIISVGVAAIAKATDGNIWTTLLIMSGIALIILAMMVAVEGIVKTADKASNVDSAKLAALTTFVTGFSKALKVLMKAISKLMVVMIIAAEASGGTSEDYKNVMLMTGEAMLGIIAIIFSMVGAMRLLLSQKTNIPDIKTMLGLIAFMVVMTFCVEKLAMAAVALALVTNIVPMESLWVSLGFITAISLVMMAIIAVIAGIAAGATDASGMMKAMLGIAAVVLVFGNAILSIASAAALLAAAGVTNEQLSSLIIIVAIVSALIVVLGVIGGIMGSGGSAGLLAFAGGILMIAAAIYVINAAIYLIVKAIVVLIATFVMLAEVWPTISNQVPAMLEDLEVTLPKFIQLVGQCIKDLAVQIIEAAPLIGAAIAAVIAAVIETGWGYIPQVVKSFLTMFDQTLDLLIDGAVVILPKLLALLLMLLAYLDANAVALGYMLASVAIKVIWGALMAIGDFLKETAIPWLIEKIIDLAKGWRSELVDGIVDSLISDEEVVATNNEIALVETTEWNAVRNNHWKYYNPKTGKYYDTMEEAQQGEIDDVLEEYKTKADENSNISVKTTANVEIDQDVLATAQATTQDSVENMPAFQKIGDNKGVTDAVSDLKGVVVDQVSKGGDKSYSNLLGELGKQDTEDAAAAYAQGGTSAVNDSAYQQFLKSQGQEAGDATKNAYSEGIAESLAGGSTTAIDTSSIMSQLNMPDTSEFTDMANGTANLEQYGISDELTAGVNVVPQIDGSSMDGLNDITNGTAKIGMDTTDMNTVMQDNTNASKENISMLEKVKASLDNLKDILKDTIIIPKNSNIDITTTIDKQVLGESVAPIVDTVNGKSQKASSRRIAGN